MYHLELLTVKLLGSIENKITKGKNGKNVPHLEITKAVLVQCNIVNNDYQQDSIVLYVYSKLFCQLLEISTSNFFFFSKTFNSASQGIGILFTDQNNQPLEIEDRINLT